MDAHRTAEARIELVERRLIALQEAGVDTAGLVSRLDLARSALAQGRPEEVPALCEDLLADARRLVEGGMAAPAPRTQRPVRTERADRPRLPVTEAVPAAVDATPLRDQVAALVGPQLMALEGRLQERIDGLAPLVESLKAQVAERPGIDTAVLEQVIESAVTPLLANLQQQMTDRFTRLSAQETAIVPRPGLDEAAAAELVATAVGGLKAELEERLVALGTAAPAVDEGRLVEVLGQRLETRLEARLEAVTEHTAMALEAIRTELRDRPAAVPATVRVQQALARTVPEATASAVDEAVAPLEQRLEQRLTAMATTLGTLEARVDDLRGVTGPDLEERFDALHGALTERMESLVGERLPEILGDSLRSLDATVAATVRDLVGAALAERPPAAAVDAESLRTALANELRADLDCQLESMAAEKGWVSINDVRAEVSQRAGLPAAATNAPATFARLEAALVEFVRQTQSQQQQFLSVLKDKVEHHTEVLTERALTGSIARPAPSSEAIEAPPAGEALDQALDPLPSTTVDEGIPDIVHSTQVLNALARGGLPLDFEEAHLAAEPGLTDPDLPPSDDLDPLSPSDQHHTLRDSQAAIPVLSGDTMPEPGPDEHPAEATAEAEPGDPPTLRTTSITIGAEPEATATAMPGDAPQHDHLGSLTGTMARAPEGWPSSETDPAPAPGPLDLSGEVLGGEQTPDVATATIGAPGHAEDELDSNVRELDRVEVAPEAVLGLDDHETATFHATETRSHSGLTPIPAELAVVPPASELVAEVDAVADDAAPEDAGFAVGEPALNAEVPTASVSATSTPPTTTRRSIGDLEAALRRLIGQELERQLGVGLPSLTAAIQGAVDEAMQRHRAEEAEHLDSRIRASVLAELDRRAPDPAKDLATLAEVLRRQASHGPAPSDLRETMVTLLQDPQVRQTVLEIVAVEAIANPGPLAELTGLRAFIRREVRQAATDRGEDLPQEALTAGP